MNELADGKGLVNGSFTTVKANTVDRTVGVVNILSSCKSLSLDHDGDALNLAVIFY